MNGLTDITPIASAIIALVFAVIAGFVIPLIRNRYGQATLDYTANLMYQVGYWISIFVRAAEQLFPEPKSGATKKQYVINKIQEKLAEWGLEIDMDTIEAQIENEVFGLNTTVLNKEHDDNTGKE